MADPADTLGLAPWVLELLRCPLPHHAELRVDTTQQALQCTQCDAVFPVVAGLPIMLIEQETESS